MARPSYRLFETRTDAGYTLDGIVASGTQYSAPMPVDEQGILGFTLQSTGTLAGTPTLWYTDEPDPSLADDTDWVQDTAWNPTAIAGAATKTKYVIEGLRTRFARVKHVKSGGTGSLYGYHVGS